MKALELADAYADAVSAHRLESLYGTSKSYTLEKAKERDEAFESLAAELRRLAAVEAERDALKADLEVERMRLAACSDVARSNTKESAERVRNLLTEYWSASCTDVASAVDREMALRTELERIKALEPVAWARIPRFTGSAQTPIVVVTNPHSTAWTALYALGSKTA